MIDGFNQKEIETLISIIIPAYNVELYIEECLLSIIKQTYKNIEIIVIDDGSTDKTSKLLDNISLKDDRICVIHKKNEGVSIARNTGIELSKGDYLVFVDADDYLAPDYIEYMIELVKNTKAEFCISKYCYTKNEEKQIEQESIEILQAEEATALLLSPVVIVGCWNKIFKKSLLEDYNIRFLPTLFYGEGLTFITTVAQLSNAVGVGNRKVYYYRRNNESSVTTKFNINNMYNGEKALEIIENQLIIKTSKVKTMLNLHRSIFSLGAVVKLKANHLEKKYNKDYRRWKSYVKNGFFQLLFCKDVTIYRKLLLFVGWICPWLMMKLDIIRRKHIFKNGVKY